MRAAKKQYGGQVVMVVDNAPCHSNIEEVLVKKNFYDAKCLGWDHAVQCLIQLNKYGI